MIVQPFSFLQQVSLTTPSPVNPVLTGRVLEVNNTIESYPGSGNTWYDISGNDYNFNQSGSATFSTTNGWSLNGSSQYLWQSSSLGTKLTGNITSSITVFVDANKTNFVADGALIAGWDDTGAKYKFLFEANADKSVESAVRVTTGVIGGTSTGTYTTGSRQIFAFTVSGSVQTRFVNDSALAGTVSTTGTWDVFNPPYTIGARLNGASVVNYFGGTIKAVVVYNRALSSTERTNVYNYLLSL